MPSIQERIEQFQMFSKQRQFTPGNGSYNKTPQQTQQHISQMDRFQSQSQPQSAQQQRDSPRIVRILATPSSNQRSFQVGTSSPTIQPFQTPGDNSINESSFKYNQSSPYIQQINFRNQQFLQENSSSPQLSNRPNNKQNAQQIFANNDRQQGTFLNSSNKFFISCFFNTNVFKYLIITQNNKII